MIVLNVQSQDRGQLEVAAELMLKDRLAIDINIQSDVERCSLNDGVLEKHRHHVLRARTKALLFPLIDRRLREVFKDDMPELFSVPIVNMDWDQILQLRHDIEDV
jgi:uncharacterized protein involved in tolerance to divalent cations